MPEEIPENYTISKRVREYINNWALTHKEPKRPLLAIGRDSYSPLQILSEFDKETPLGRRLAWELEKTLEENLRTEWERNKTFFEKAKEKIRNEYGEDVYVVIENQRVIDSGKNLFKLTKRHEKKEYILITRANFE